MQYLPLEWIDHVQTHFVCKTIKILVDPILSIEGFSMISTFTGKIPPVVETIPIHFQVRWSVSDSSWGLGYNSAKLKNPMKQY
jgi:hypothetical protein